MNQYLIGSAVVPSILLVWFFHRRDLYPEPPRVLWATFLLGVLTVIPVLIVVGPFADDVKAISDPFAMGLAKAFAAAAIPEEFFKFLVVVLYCSRHKEFCEPMDGIIYGVVASLGFATLENVLYVADGGYGVALMRAFTAVPGHALTGAIMGYFVGQARFTKANKARNWTLALLAPTLLHGIYDFPLMVVSAYSESHNGKVGAVGLLMLLVLATLVFEWIYTVKKTRMLRRTQDVHFAANAARTPLAVPAVAVAAMGGVAATTPGTRGKRFVGILYLSVGTALAAFGGLMTLGLIINLVDESKEHELASIIITGLLIAVLPLGLGFLLFRAGLRSLNRASAPR